MGEVRRIIDPIYVIPFPGGIVIKSILVIRSFRKQSKNKLTLGDLS